MNMRKLYDNNVVPRTPSQQGKWVSVEIEMLFPHQKAKHGFEKEIVGKRLTSFVCVKEDGSIDTDDDEGEDQPCGRCFECRHGERYDCSNPDGGQQTAEIVVTFLDDGKYKVLKQVCSLIRKYKGKVNDSCGLHVHFDMRDKTAKEAQLVGMKLALYIDALKRILPESRRDSSYCDLDINSIEDDEDNRYAFINLVSYHKHKTIEIRAHQGTVDFQKIKNWIQILKTLMKSKTASETNTVKELVSAVKFPQTLRNYLMHRENQFSGTRHKVSTKFRLREEASEAA